MFPGVEPAASTTAPSFAAGETRFRSELVRSLALAVIAFVLFAAGRSPFVGQWDSFDYLKQIVTHRLSDLGFGRPAFLGYNVLLWECARRLFNLKPLAVETVAMAGVVLAGTAGVLLFRRLARQMLTPHAARLATAAFLLSPVYSFYSGSVMTEVPMIVTLLAAAALLWPDQRSSRMVRTLAAGALFGVAIGVREQAAALAAAFGWMIWMRTDDSGERFRRLLVFGLSSFAVAAVPVGVLFLWSPPSFMERMRVWLRAIPTGERHFWLNVGASAAYTFLLAPAIWVALLGAGVSRVSRTLVTGRQAGASAVSVSRPFCGVLCGFALPLALLWRNADVQIHPRYALVVLPAAVLFCAALYDRWLPGPKARVTWFLLQILLFVGSQGVLQSFRRMQTERKAFARAVLNGVPDNACLVAGAYSPVFDYYRAVGVRPDWRILWPGWGWEAQAAAGRMREAWAEGRPVFLCDGPCAWLNFEGERLDLHLLLSRNCRPAAVPGLQRVLPPPRQNADLFLREP